MSERLAGRGAIVMGVDASSEMVAAARAMGIDAHAMGGHTNIASISVALRAVVSRRGLREPVPTADYVRLQVIARKQ